MKKITILLALLLIPLVYSLEECTPEISTLDLPCRVTTTWQYPNACDTYNVRIYDKNATLLNTRNLGTFGIYCNFTFNYTTAGSYYFNFSSGDTGSLVVGETMQQFYNLAIFGSYFFAVCVLIVFIHVFKKDGSSSLVYGIIATVLSAIMLALMLGGLSVFPGVTFIIDVDYYLGILVIAIGLYTFVISNAFYTDIKEARAEKLNY